ncbi:peptidoglycan-binding domain-containing protein [Oryzihumus sp.]
MSTHFCLPPRLAAAGAAILLALVAGAVAPTSALAAPAGDTPGEARSPIAPRVPSGLPSEIEELAEYVPADSCDPTVRRGTKELGQLLVGTYPHTSYQITRACGADPLPTSEHYDGRALDWMVSVRTRSQKAEAKTVLSWLFATDKAGHRYANARRLGVMYIIWNGRIWGAYDAKEGWRPYSSCASHPGVAYDTTCHRNHVHISLSWEGAQGRTSFWSKQQAAPDYGPCRQPDMNWAAPYTEVNPTRCPTYPRVVPPAHASPLEKVLTAYSGMRLHRGATGPAVTAVQQAVGLTGGGTFGPKTAGAVKGWQRAHHLTASGVVNIPTWRTLLEANAPPTKSSTG